MARVQLGDNVLLLLNDDYLLLFFFVYLRPLRRPKITDNLLDIVIVVASDGHGCSARVLSNQRGHLTAQRLMALLALFDANPAHVHSAAFTLYSVNRVDILTFAYGAAR